MTSDSVKDMLPLYPLGHRNHGQLPDLQFVGSRSSVSVMLLLRSVLGEQMEAHVNQRFFYFAFICIRSTLSVVYLFLPHDGETIKPKEYFPF